MSAIQREPSAEKLNADGRFSWAAIASPLTIEPGATHDYQSFCVLRGPSGWMQGSYTFVRPDGDRFEAHIPRFDLQVAEVEGPHA